MLTFEHCFRAPLAITRAGSNALRMHDRDLSHVPAHRDSRRASAILRSDMQEREKCITLRTIDELWADH